MQISKIWNCSIDELSNDFCKFSVITQIECQNGGQPDGTGKCICQPPYFGVQCASECVNGAIIDDTCECDEGFTGRECENGMFL